MTGRKRTLPFGNEGEGKTLEVVLKCDSFGTVEAVSTLIKNVRSPEVEIELIYAGVGAVSKSDLLMAMTGSRLVLGFNVEIMPKLEAWVKERGIEVRLYNVVYRLTEDLKVIVDSFSAVEPEEKITGKAEVIELFKTSHGGMILGCEVKDGTLAVGKPFRVISAMGPIYSGTIESLQIERKSIKEARAGQQIGLKIPHFSKAKIGDLVECYETPSTKVTAAWKPSGSIHRIKS